MQKKRGAGGLKFLRPEKVALKNHANFTPENWVYMIFCGVDAYFPWGKKGALKKIAVQKEALKFFHAEIFLHQPPLQVFVNGPLAFQ